MMGSIVNLNGHLVLCKMRLIKKLCERDWRADWTFPLLNGKGWVNLKNLHGLLIQTHYLLLVLWAERGRTGFSHLFELSG